MKYLVLLSFFVANLAYAVLDQRVISELYVDDSRSMAIKLTNGFPNATANKECTTNNDWAGVAVNSPEMKSTLLAAKFAKATVSLSINGCTSDGSWLKISSVYLK